MDKVEEVLKIDVITNVLNVMLILFENFLFCYIVDYFCNDKKINKKRFLIVFFLITINSPIFFNFFSSMWINCLINDAMIFLVIGTAYRKSLKKALISMFSTSLIIISVTMIVQNNFYNIFIGRCLTENKHFYLFCIVVFFRVVVAILQLKYIDKMCKLYQYILDEDNYLFVFITILFAWSYAFCLSDSYILGLNNETMKSILNVWFVLFVIFALLYIIRIASKSREINRLNDDLKDNNNRLRKIKHDYGAQISYFYGLCLMDRYNDLEIALKDVIDRTKYSNKIKRSDSILQLAVETAIKSNDIKVTIEEKADLSKLIIP
ncbi:MAG: hypothetical protein E7213_00815, partial [Clostridium sp.]|nr:hypothetical protein [Clostridium sp.]